MPCQEVSGEVDSLCLLHMSDSEVIKLMAEHVSQFSLVEHLMKHTRDLAPAATAAGVLAGFFCKHLTALT